MQWKIENTVCCVCAMRVTSIGEVYNEKAFTRYAAAAEATTPTNVQLHTYIYARTYVLYVSVDL